MIIYYSAQGATLERKDVLKTVSQGHLLSSPRAPGKYEAGSNGEKDG